MIILPKHKAAISIRISTKVPYLRRHSNLNSLMSKTVMLIAKDVLNTWLNCACGFSLRHCLKTRFLFHKDVFCS